jgi:ATP-binding cassette, subfamily B, bacterial
VPPTRPEPMRIALRSVWMILRSSFAASPAATAATMALHPIGYLETPFVALGLRVMADGMAAGDSRLLVAAVAVLLSALCVFHIVNHTAWQLSLGLEDRVAMALDRRIGELVSATPGLEHFERPEYVDRLEILRERGWMLGRAMYTLPMELGTVVRAVLTFVLLASVDPLLLLLPLFVLPSIFIDTYSERAFREAEEGCAEGLRRARHLYETSTRPMAAKELRVFGLAGELLSRHHRELMGVRTTQTAAHRAAVLRSTLGWLLYSVGFAGAAALVAWRVSTGTARIGDLVLTLTLAAQVNAETRVVIELVGWAQWLSRIGSHLVWLEDFAKARSAAKRGKRVPPAELREGITVDGLSFRYPGTDRWVLRDVRLRLPVGTTVAIVGENGAGKTTLAKLLCGFYLPTEGRIAVDGQDLEDLDSELWLTRVAASFQDYHRFELLAGEAVGIGDLPRKDEESRVRRAIDRADAADVIGALPGGLATQLGPTWPGGVDLSGGQWQKVALARALMRETPLLLILDEPTASLDPQTEHALFERQAQAARRTGGAVTLVVSHRFSTVARADSIVVLADGRVVEHGTHADLVARNGLYAELYAIQARGYRAGGKAG